MREYLTFGWQSIGQQLWWKTVPFASEKVLDETVVRELPEPHAQGLPLMLGP